MDFCILDQDELKIGDITKDDDVLKPFLTFVSVSDFEELLKSAEYNDTFLKKNLGFKLYPVASDCILKQNYDGIKLR